MWLTCWQRMNQLGPSGPQVAPKGRTQSFHESALSFYSPSQRTWDLKPSSPVVLWQRSQFYSQLFLWFALFIMLSITCAALCPDLHERCCINKVWLIGDDTKAHDDQTHALQLLKCPHTTLTADIVCDNLHLICIRPKLFNTGPLVI